MSDKASVVANAIPALPVVPIGSFFGLDPVTMVVGFIAGLVALMHIGPPEGTQRTPIQIFLLITGSAFLSGVFAPLAIAAGVTYLPWLKNVHITYLSMAAATLIGAAPYIAPLLWRLWRQTKG